MHKRCSKIGRHPPPLPVPATLRARDFTFCPCTGKLVLSQGLWDCVRIHPVALHHQRCDARHATLALPWLLDRRCACVWWLSHDHAVHVCMPTIGR